MDEVIQGPGKPDLPERKRQPGGKGFNLIAAEQDEIPQRDRFRRPIAARLRRIGEPDAPGGGRMGEPLACFAVKQHQIITAYFKIRGDPPGKRTLADSAGTGKQCSGTIVNQQAAVKVKKFPRQ